jgi:hypothetical protein
MKRPLQVALGGHTGARQTLGLRPLVHLRLFYNATHALNTADWSLLLVLLLLLLQRLGAPPSLA